MAVLIDTNVLLDFLSADPVWGPWSRAALVQVASEELWTNAMVYAELCGGFSSVSGADASIQSFGLVWREIPREGLFLAAQAYKTYRKRGGTKANVLPDFIIGGHAEATGATLVTRDASRYQTYFPAVNLIAP